MLPVKVFIGFHSMSAKIVEGKGSGVVLMSHIAGRALDIEILHIPSCRVCCSGKKVSCL